METSEDVLRLNDIPESCQRGWWRVTSQTTIRQILLNLNSRGIRERNLQKQFHKYLNDSKQLLKTMPNDQGEEQRGFFNFTSVVIVDKFRTQGNVLKRNL